jgi:hypothetical protein
LYDISTGFVRKIKIPHDHPCSVERNSHHEDPLMFKNTIVIRCQDMKQWITTVFNITWIQAEGNLSAGPSWYGENLKPMFAMPDGNLILIEHRPDNIFFIRHFYPELNFKHPRKLFKIPSKFINDKYQWLFDVSLLIVGFKNKNVLSGIRMFINLCFPLDPWEEHYTCCTEVKVQIKPHIKYRIHRFGTRPLLIHTNGDLLLPVMSETFPDKGNRREVFTFSKLFKDMP